MRQRAAGRRSRRRRTPTEWPKRTRPSLITAGRRRTCSLAASRRVRRESRRRKVSSATAVEAAVAFVSNLKKVSQKVDDHGTQRSSQDKTRNIGIMAHIDAGKTTTTERILFYTGVNYKMGDARSMTAPPPWTGWCRSRNAGSRSPPLRPPAMWNDHRINIIDTPGSRGFHCRGRAFAASSGWRHGCLRRGELVWSPSRRPSGGRRTATRYLAWRSSTRWTGWAPISIVV